jgi:hypothetical protein
LKFGSYREQPFTREDARKIADNVMGFFQVLRQWADEEKGAKAIPKQIARTLSERGGKDLRPTVTAAAGQNCLRVLVGGPLWIHI